jgi:hypothetical protein
MVIAGHLEFDPATVAGRGGVPINTMRQYTRKTVKDFNGVEYYVTQDHGDGWLSVRLVNSSEMHFCGTLIHVDDIA